VGSRAPPDGVLARDVHDGSQLVVSARAIDAVVAIAAHVRLHTTLHHMSQVCGRALHARHLLNVRVRGLRHASGECTDTTRSIVLYAALCLP
jgi:hypothetical protein